MFKLETRNANLWYGEKQALKDISIGIDPNTVTAFIGPSGCGKSTLLRCFNRMNDLIENTKIEGDYLLDNDNIYKETDVYELRKRVGMVFQKPNPFPKSIYENVAYGLRLQGVKSKRILDTVVENSLRGAALWDEVKDRLHDNAFGLSGGQKQRLSIARAVLKDAPILILDEATSSVDTVTEALIQEAAVQAAEYQRTISREYDTYAKEELANSGMEITELSDEQLAAFQEAVQPVYEQWEDEIGADLIQRVQEQTQN